MINGERQPLRPFEKGEIGPDYACREGMVPKRRRS